jgi:hypothetical protein
MMLMRAQLLNMENTVGPEGVHDLLEIEVVSKFLNPKLSPFVYPSTVCSVTNHRSQRNSPPSWSIS